MSAQPVFQTRQYTFEEYIQLEEQTGIRYEYYNGEVFAMAGGSLNHSDIADNLNELIKGTFRPRGCRSFQENAKLQLESENRYLYPDIVLTCHLEDTISEHFIQNPVLIAEVLSPSTERDDRGRKWRLYRRIASLRYYLLVSQHQPYIELYSRTNTTALFHLQEFGKLEEVISFPELDFSMTLQQIYDGIRFPIADSDSSNL